MRTLSHSQPRSFTSLCSVQDDSTGQIQRRGLTGLGPVAEVAGAVETLGEKRI